jgi:hypothetical protein
MTTTTTTMYVCARVCVCVPYGFLSRYRVDRSIDTAPLLLT